VERVKRRATKAQKKSRFFLLENKHALLRLGIARGLVPCKEQTRTQSIRVSSTTDRVSFMVSQQEKRRKPEKPNQQRPLTTRPAAWAPASPPRAPPRLSAQPLEPAQVLAPLPGR
jgi:biotin carboxyl carrier protein